MLGAPNAQMAETATKYSLEVAQAEDLPVALQRCWLQAQLQPSGPVFLSVPMNFMQEPMAEVGLRRTVVLDDVVPAGLSQLAEVLRASDAGSLAIVADYAVGASDAVEHLSRLASCLGADVYSAPFHVQGVVNPLHPRYKGQLPATTREIRSTLSHYDRLLLLGEKIDTFTFNGVQAIPASLKIYHLAPSTRQLGFDYPCDLAVLGDVDACLKALVDQLAAPADSPSHHDGAAVLAELQAQYPAEGTHASDALILDLLQQLPRDCHLITEAHPRMHWCSGWPLHLASATSISHLVVVVLAGPCHQGLDWHSRPVSLRSVSSVMEVLSSPSTRSGVPPGIRSPWCSSAL